MSTEFETELVHELQESLERAAKGIRIPEEMRKARNEMNRMREELRQKIGTVDVAVDLIRDARNQ
jgi:DNA-directed RNA polymerase sigma subunit (sigma70/sigma32)